MADLSADDVVRMRDSVSFVGPDAGRRLSRFWLLLVLSSVIASAGVITDSTATVIGAMIVAPLLLPIQGTMLSVVFSDQQNLRRCIGLLVTGAAAAVAIGWALSLLVFTHVVAANNSQVAGRVHPTLMDLISALATGAVGSIALVRKDISDTLPGVAIAISLVPPLCVVGVTLHAGAYDQSLGALLLFLTNVGAIIGVGMVVMAVYRVRSDEGRGPSRRAVATVTSVLAVIALLLTISSVNIVRGESRQAAVGRVADTWAARAGWSVVDLKTQDGRVVVDVEGPPPLPDTGALESALRQAGLDPHGVRVDLVPRETRDLGDSGSGS